MKYYFNPHDSQQLLLEKAKRFNVLNCGRRWGKTMIALFLIMSTLERRQRVAYFMPSASRFGSVWQELIAYMEPLASGGFCKINKSRHDIIFKNGAFCKFWSLEDKISGRGEKYHRLIVDEAAYADDLEDAWDKRLRATLADFKGDGWFLSTPNGADNYFYELSERDNPNWLYFHAPSWTNPLLGADEIDEIRSDTPPQIFDQEYGAEFLTLGKDLFFYSNGSLILENAPVYEDAPLYVSFDFNVNPCTLLVGQKIFNPRAFHGGCFIYDEFQVPGTTAELCEVFKQSSYFNHPGGLIVTGDSAGSSLDTRANVLHNNYDIIRNSFGLSNAQLVNIRESNPYHTVSRNTCNTVMHNQLLTISPKCKVLLKDLRIAKATTQGRLKKDRKNYKMDAADAMRYMHHAWFPNGIPEIRSYKAMVNQAA